MKHFRMDGPDVCCCVSNWHSLLYQLHGVLSHQLNAFISFRPIAMHGTELTLHRRKSNQRIRRNSSLITLSPANRKTKTTKMKIKLSLSSCRDFHSHSLVSNHTSRHTHNEIEKIPQQPRPQKHNLINRAMNIEFEL